MRRMPRNLETLTDLETRMAAEADAMAKTGRALMRQRERLERQAEIARYIMVGQMVEQLGLPVDDLNTLEQLLKTLGERTRPLHPNHALSTTSDVPSAEKEPGA